MRPARPPSSTASHPHADDPGQPIVWRDLIQALGTLREQLLASEQRWAEALARVRPQQRQSARNLVHYLALRSQDLRELQTRLGWLGLSSLGRAESHVLAAVDKLLGLLHRLTGQRWTDRSPEVPASSVSGPQRLREHTTALLGPAQHDRDVRIMVTLPGEAATDPGLVRELISAGMDVARINCAHDDATAWTAMARHVRRAAKVAQRVSDAAAAKCREALQGDEDRDLVKRYADKAAGAAEAAAAIRALKEEKDVYTT